MMLTRMSRVRGLCLLFVALTLVMFVILPLGIIPFVIIEGAFLNSLAEYRYYLECVRRGDFSGERGQLFLTHVGFSVGLAAIQVFFIAPLVGPVRITEGGRSLRWSMLSAMLIALCVSVGLVFALLEGVALALSDTEVSTQFVEHWGGVAYYSLFFAWLVVGIPWSLALWKIGSSRNPNGLALAARKLLAGTALELALALPIYALARRREDCVCAMSSFWALLVGLLALLLLTGPLAILFLTRHARRNWARGACTGCGYPRRSGASVCSECGHAFTVAEAAA